jgi:hypothetical protein
MVGKGGIISVVARDGRTSLGCSQLSWYALCVLRANAAAPGRAASTWSTV